MFNNAPTVLCLTHLPEKRIAPLNGLAMDTMDDVHLGLERILLGTGRFPRNVDLQYRNARQYPDKTKGYCIGSFELKGGLDGVHNNSFQSFTHGLVLLQTGDISEIGGKQGLYMRIREKSKINITDLGEIITDFISEFIKKHAIKWKEVTTKKEGLYPFPYHLSVLPEQWDRDEKTEFLFSISPISHKGTDIYFTDLTPVHPDFLHELLLYIDKKYIENKVVVG